MRPFPQVCRNQSRSRLCINFICKKTILLTIFVYFDLFWLFFSKSLLFLLRYIVLESINSGLLISHFFKITNHRSIFFWKYRFIFKLLFDWHRSIDYRVALSICPPLPIWAQMRWEGGVTGSQPISTALHRSQKKTGVLTQYLT
jgi:hypothetical protein